MHIVAVSPRFSTKGYPKWSSLTTEDKRSLSSVANAASDGLTGSDEDNTTPFSVGEETGVARFPGKSPVTKPYSKPTQVDGLSKLRL